MANDAYKILWLVAILQPNTQEKPHWLKNGIENLMTPVGTVPKDSNPNISIILHIIM